MLTEHETQRHDREGRDLPVTEARTLPDHAKCDAHRKYKLSCIQYECLLRESGQQCQICGLPGTEMPQQKLFIDHDVTPWGVRGLLCLKCNSTLGITKDEWAMGRSYLANSWWRRQCADAGLSASLGPEPPVGSAIRNQWGTVWIRSSEQWWSAPNQGGHGWSPSQWRGLFSSYGPHNLVPFDVKSALDAPATDFLRLELRTGPYWAEVRKVLDIPESVKRPYRSRGTELKPSMPWLASPEAAVKALRVFFSRDQQVQLARLLMEDARTGREASI